MNILILLILPLVGYGPWESVGPEGGVADYNYAYGQLDLTKSADEYGDITLSATGADNTNADGNDNVKVFISWTKGF